MKLKAFTSCTLILLLGSYPLPAVAAKRSDKKAMFDLPSHGTSSNGISSNCNGLLESSSIEPLPKQSVPLSLLDKFVGTQGTHRLFFSPQGRSVVFTSSWSDFTFKLEDTGRVQASGFGGGTPSAKSDAHEMIKIGFISSTIAKGLIRYAYYNAYKDSDHAFWRTLEFLNSEVPELFVTGGELHVLGFERYRPQTYRAESDLDQ